MNSSAVLADSIPSQYSPIIEKYIEAINKKWDGIKLQENKMYSEMAIYYDAQYRPTNLNTYGYLVTDLNNDGTPELLIDDLHGTTKNPSPVADLYSIVNNQPVQLFFKSISRLYLYN